MICPDFINGADVLYCARKGSCGMLSGVRMDLKTGEVRLLEVRKRYHEKPPLA